jgi:ribosomal protein S18 acetylase RimI-like enzyme
MAQTQDPIAAPAEGADALGLRVEDELDPLSARFLDDRLYELNAARTGVDDGRMLAIWLRDDAGATVAGLYGWTWAGYCEVRALWVREQDRGRGLGRALLTAAEAEARARGAEVCLLDTHSFQAPGFYRKLGYEEVAVIEQCPPGHRRHCFRKRLGPT